MLRSSYTLRKNTDYKLSQDQLEQNSGKIMPHLYVHLYSVTVSAWMSSAQISLFLLYCQTLENGVIVCLYHFLRFKNAPSPSSQPKCYRANHKNNEAYLSSTQLTSAQRRLSASFSEILSQLAAILQLYQI